MPRLGTLVVLLLLLALPGAAQAAGPGGETGDISGSVRVTVVGPGTVTGTGISCPGDCRDDKSWLNTQVSPRFALTANPAAGVTVEWTGCDSVNGNVCEGRYGSNELDGTQVAVKFTDTVKPTISVVAPAVGSRTFGTKSTITAAVDALDNQGVKQVEFKLDLNPWIVDDTPPFGTDRFDASWPAKDLPNGTYDIEVVARDFADNTTRITIPIVVDKVAPNLTLTTGVQEGAWHAKGVAGVNFTKGTDVAVTQCALAPGAATPAEGAFGDCTMGHYHEGLPSADGDWTIAVRARDAAGNEQLRTRTFKVDATNPFIEVGGGPSTPSAKQGSDVELTPLAHDANLDEVECLPPGDTTWVTCPSGGPVIDHNPAEGQRTWRFRAVDKAGNAATAERSWVSDGTGPAITLTGLPAEGATIAPTTVTIGVSATDAVSGVPAILCAWGVDEPEGTCPEGPQKLLDGVYTFVVRAADGVGNESTVVRRFTVKTPAKPDGGGGDKKPGGGGSGGGEQQPPAGGGTTTDPPATAPPAAGPIATPRADRTAPVLTVTAPRKARSAALRKGLALTVGCSEACTGTVQLTGPKGLKAAASIVRAGRVTLKLKAGALKKAMGAKGRATLTVVVTVKDAAGNVATRRVTLKATR